MLIQPVSFFGIRAAQGGATYSFFNGTESPNVLYDDGVSGDYELGMAFYASVPGEVTQIKYWKDSRETVTHIGKIWLRTSATAGTLLKSETFVNETTGGWQTQTLGTPYAIAANTNYIVSVNVGRYYGSTAQGLQTQINKNNIIYTLAGTGSSNGNFNTTAGQYPSGSFNNSNYFRDITFRPT